MAVLDAKQSTGDTRIGGDFLDALAREIRRQAQSGASDVSLNSLLKTAPTSRRQTERLFRDRFLTSPGRYFRDCQQDKAFVLLAGGKDVLSAAVESGFASTGRLHDAVLSRRGMTPGEVRRRGAGVTIRYAFFDTPLGSALICATERGKCALRLCQFGEKTGDDAPGNLALSDVQNDFPEAVFVEDVGAVQGYADQLIAFLEDRAETFVPRLDVLRGTTFQREVWAEIQNIRPGETISYTELARRVGRPSAVRAVAGACAANRIAVAIPCHRVVRENGDIAGYRWGLEWKRRLLALEAQYASLTPYPPLSFRREGGVGGERKVDTTGKPAIQ